MTGEEAAIMALTNLLVQHNDQHAADMREIRERLASGDTRMAGMEITLRETGKVGRETLAQATRTNGRMTDMEKWRDAHDARMREDAADARGEQRAEARHAQKHARRRAAVKTTATFVIEKWELFAAGILILLAVVGNATGLLPWP